MLFTEYNKLRPFFANKISYSIVLTIFWHSFMFAQTSSDSLWGIWEDTSQSDTVRIEAIHEYIVLKYLNTNPDSAYYFSKLEFNFANERGLKKHKGPALRTQSRALYRLGKYELTLEKYLQALKVFEEVEDKKGISDVLNGIGLVYKRLGDEPKAVQYFYESLKIKEEIKDGLGIAKILNNIGVLHYNNGNYDKATDFYSQSLSAAEKIGAKVLISRALNNLGSTYDYLDQDSLAIDYYKRSIKLSEEMGDDIGTARTLSNIGIIYENQQKLDEALTYHSRSLKMREKIGEKNGIAVTLNNIGNNYYNQGNYDKSIVNCKRALKIAQEIDEKRTITRASYTLYSSYFAKKRFKEALLMFELYVEVKEMLDIEESQIEILRQENDYENKKRELQQEIDRKLQAQKLKNKNILTALISIFLLIVIGFTVNTFSNLRKQKNLTKEVEKSNTNKQRLFGIISHDLINPFNAILGYTRLLDNDYESFSEQERKKFIAIINKYANNNYDLTKRLLDWSKVQQDQLVVKKTRINCKEIVLEAIQPYQVLADKKQIQINMNISDDAFIEADQNMMQTVIGNLFVNAVKYTPQKGKVVFDLVKNNDGTINLEIEDNGIGMSQEQLNCLFDITKRNTSKGTNNEKGNGLGLILSKEFVELQKGTLKLISQQNIGSKAIITI